jgi:hypothetical protein
VLPCRARIEADKFSTRAGQERLADVVTFTQWLSALNEEIIANPSARPGEDYRPPEGAIPALHLRRRRTAGHRRCAGYFPVEF